MSIEEALRTKLQGRTTGIDKFDRLWDAAVLLPLVYENGVPSILFEVRAAALRRQPGEICFPGGKKECSDATLAATAVRETCEELGLQSSDITLLGELDALVTHAGPIIHPFVGVLPSGITYNYNPAEVECLFTVPLKWLLACEPRVGYVQLADKPREDFPFDLVPLRQRNWRYHKEYKVYFYPYGDKVIWGLTARMLHAFLENYRELLSSNLELK